MNIDIPDNFFFFFLNAYLIPDIGVELYTPIVVSMVNGWCIVFIDFLYRIQ